VDTAKAWPSAKVCYSGDRRGAELLRRLGVPFDPYPGGDLLGGTILVFGPGAKELADPKAARRHAPRVIALGLSVGETRSLAGSEVKVTSAELHGDPHDYLIDLDQLGVSQADVNWRTKLQIGVLDGFPACNLPQGVFCQVAPWMLDYEKKPYLRTSYRRNVFLVSRMLHNLGVPAATPLLERLAKPAGVSEFIPPAEWKGLVDREGVGRKGEWFRPDFDDAKWQPIRVPGMFEDQIPELADYNGLFWYRLRFKLPAAMTREKLTLTVGPVDDESWVWLNGRYLGEVTKQTNPKDYWAFPRKYAMEPGMLNDKGENVLVVLVNDTFQKGGLTGVPILAAPGAWLNSYYVDQPVADDDPYRYYRW
jgi:hypothetical protein